MENIPSVSFKRGLWYLFPDFSIPLNSNQKLNMTCRLLFTQAYFITEIFFSVKKLG